MEKFKISNVSNAYGTVIMFSSVAVCALIGYAIGNISGGGDEALAAGLFIGLCLGIVVGFMLMAFRESEVEYDGLTIKLSSKYGKNEIDLSTVKSVSYEFIKGVGRGSFDTICVTFTFFEQEGVEKTPVDLHQTADGEKLDKVLKGDRSSFPLLQMYDDIIARYPEKKAEEKTEE